MKVSTSIALAVVGTVALGLALTSSSQDNSSSLFEKSMFEIPEARYDSVQEFAARMKLYFQSKAQVEAHNSDPTKTHKLTINRFADLSSDEKRKVLGFKGAVGPVENQGSNCGSSWAYAVTGSLAGFDKIHKGGELYELSEQQLIDCDDTNFGCSGGNYQPAFEYTAKYPLETEADYPYTGNQDKCKYNKSKGKSFNKGYKTVPANSKQALLEAVAQGPIPTALDFTTDQTLMYYSGGIVTDAKCGTQVNHAMLIVGYGVENDTQYYIVKNTWGSSWGENGYVRIAAVEGSGICGIQAIDTYYPEL